MSPEILMSLCHTNRAYPRVERAHPEAILSGPLEIEFFDWGNDGGSFAYGEDHRNELWSPPPWNDIEWPTTNRGYAIVAYKKFLYYAAEQGWFDFPDYPLLTATPYFGGYVRQAAAQWQRQYGLDISGKIGYATTKSFCRKLFDRDEKRYSIPNRLACRLMDLESGFYPASYNTGGDWWLGQQHYRTDGPGPTNPADRSRLGYNTLLICQELRGYYLELSARFLNSAPDELWRAAVMSYNAPAWADDWLAAGFPTSGGGTVSVGNWTGDKYEWCTLYTNAVYSREC